MSAASCGEALTSEEELRVMAMKFRQAIDAIQAQYPSALAVYQPGLGWRIMSGSSEHQSGSDMIIPLGPYRPDYENAMIAAAENIVTL
jgi:hypothetical protein